MPQIQAVLRYKLLIRISSALHLITKSSPKMKASATSMSANKKIQTKICDANSIQVAIQRSSFPHHGPMKTTAIHLFQWYTVKYLHIDLYQQIIY